MGSKRECNLSDCSRKHVARGYCKLHYRRFMEHGDPLINKPAPEKIDLNGERICNKCKKRKILGDYPPDSRNRLGRKRICRECIGEYAKSWSADNKERVRENQRLARVRRVFGSEGLELDQRRQAGDPCDICGNRTIKMAIDHCHKTGRIRGLLCKDCNLILGWVRDDPSRLQDMADYLLGFL